MVKSSSLGFVFAIHNSVFAPPYSYLSATIGSTFVALRAGM
jgi:hypothetical protein